MRDTARPEAHLEAVFAQRPRWVRWVQRWLTNPAEAEEVVDAALARVFSRPPPEGVVPERWLGRVLRNATIDALRRRAAELRALEGLSREPLPEPPAGRACACVHDEVSRLKPSYAEVIDAVHAHALPLASFAASARLTVNNATVRLHRARRALRERVEARCGACAAEGCRDCDCTPSARAL